MNLAENHKAFKDYSILEDFEVGLELTGQEVKAVKLGRAALTGSYVDIRGNELYLIGSSIPPYQPLNASSSYNPQRPRKLLMHKNEISYLFGKKRERGLTLIPISMYNSKRGRIKLKLGLARGKKHHDRRELLKKKDADMEMRRAFKANIR